MAREFFDFDPLTGVAEYVEWHPDGGFSLTTEQDVEPILDFCKEMANTGGAEHNFKGEVWIYAAVPPVVQAQLFKRGINFLDPNDTWKVVDAVNKDYPYCKLTHRNHALK